MKLPKRENLLTKENILKVIDEYDILRMYYPADRKLVLNRATLSPFRGEKDASFIVGTKYGEITYKDLGDIHYRGDVWTFVRQIEGLSSFNDVLLSIDKRFNLGLSTGSPNTNKPDIINWEKPDIEIQKPFLIQASLTNKSISGEEYLNQYHLTLKDLNIFGDTKVAFAKELYINKIRQTIGKFCLIYNLKNEKGNWIKAYRPLSDKKIKWRSSIPFTEMHGIDELIGCKKAILTKSIKDASVITKYTGLKTTVLQAEDISAISDKSMEILKSIDELYIATDIDRKGLDVSWELTRLLKCKHVNAPYWVLDKGGTDFGDMIKLCGPECIIQHFKNKGII